MLTNKQHHSSCPDLPSFEPSCPNLPGFEPNVASPDPIPIAKGQRHHSSCPNLPSHHWHRCLHPTSLDQPNCSRLHWCRQQGFLRRCRSPGRRWSRCRPLSDSISGQLLSDGYGRTILHLLEFILTTRHGKRFISRSCNSLA